MLPFALLILLFTQCTDSEKFIDDIGDIDAFYCKVQTLETNVTLQSESNYNLLTDRNSLIVIPANAFQSPDGQEVEGTITFTFVEIFNRAHMLMYNVPTITDDNRLLESEGVFHLSARQEDQELVLRPEFEITIKTSDSSFREGMKLFYGSENENGEFGWELNNSPNNSVSTEIWGVEIEQVWWETEGYVFNCNELTWISVDRFVDVPEEQRADVCVDLPGTDERIYSNESTVVLMIFNDLNSIVKLNPTKAFTAYCEPYGLSPIDSDVTFVVISDRGNDVYHFGMKNATLENNQIEFIEPTEKSLEEILDILGMF